MLVPGIVSMPALSEPPITAAVWRCPPPPTAPHLSPRAKRHKTAAFSFEPPSVKSFPALEADHEHQLV